MIRFCHSNRGSISVFLLLILLPTFILAGVIIDGSRIYASRNIVSGAGDLAMNAALADYDSTLKDMYSLFAMASEKVPDDKVEQYFKESINSNNLASGSYDSLPVYLTLSDSLSIDRVENTESYQTQVMLQQVLEYSKYRIPIYLISSGILDGLDSFDGMDRKLDAVKSQLKFEEELTDLQQLLEDLKEEFDAQDVLYRYFKSTYPSIISDTERNYLLISKLLIASYILLESDIGAEDGSAMDLMKKFVAEAGDLTEPSGNNYNTANTALGNFETLYNLVKINNGIDDPQAVYEGLEKNTDEWHEADLLLENYQDKLEKAFKCDAKLHSCITPLIQETNSKLNEAYKNADTAIKHTEKIIELSEDVKEKNTDGSSLKNAHKDFGEKIGNLDAGDMRDSMQEEYDDYDRLLDNDKVDILINAAKKNKTFYEEMKAGLEGITYCSMEICIANYSSDDFYGSAVTYAGGVTSNSGLSTAGNNFYNTEFRGSDFTISVALADLSNEDFYQFVQDKCNKDNEDKEKKKQEIENANENLKKGDAAKEDLVEKDDVSTDKVDLSDVPTAWLEQIATTESETNIGTGGGADNNSKRKEASKAARQSMDEVTEQTGGLSSLSSSISGGSISDADGSLGMHILESLLITGYEGEMLSYYTVDKDRDGNTQTQNSLTGYQFSTDNNVMYKSEMEYLLYGKDVPAKNVRNSKATLYTIRFGLNIIGAFSNRTLRAEADAAALAITAGVASFAYPLVKSVIIIGAAYVETYKDMENLLNGKAVDVIKFGGTWHLTGYSSSGTNNFKLDYHQYLILFLAIKNLGESGMAQSLARTADCIELNVRNKGSTMKNKQTMITLDATVGVKTSFMKNAVTQINAQGGASSEIRDNDFDVRYHGILGY